ncbi:SDR family oxidoreductase [Kitasatospora sp. NPDC052868]|uniref:SDR family oxidoreductase n=1 Tax=Kitasatospora sp. NPDC052868 TaxID=3364060 RepID=UPI0037CB46A2
MYLITGATGTVGRHLISQLLAAGAPVRAVTRNPGPAAALGLPDRVGLVRLDPADGPAALAPALEGATALFLHPRAVGDGASDLVALARERGVRKVVALSALNVDDPLNEQPSRYRGDRNKEAEQAAADSGLAWTSLRAASFAGNALQAWGPQIRAGDLVRYPFARFQESPLDERDLAEVAALALLTDDLIDRQVRLTGPETLSHEESVAVIGRPLRFQEVPPHAAAEGMIRHGLPEPFVTALMARYIRHAGRAQHPATGELAGVLGRPARTFAEWAADHTADFRSAAFLTSTFRGTELRSADPRSADLPSADLPSTTEHAAASRGPNT